MVAIFRRAGCFRSGCFLRKKATMSNASRWSLVCVVLALPAGVHGQAVVGGSLTGIVRDTAEAVVPGVEVTLTNDATSVKFTTKTNEVGSYTFSSLAPGRHTLLAKMEGFAPVSVTG